MTQQKAAIGLEYDTVTAPSVAVKGFGELADDIIRLAEEKGIMIHQDEALANSLSHLEIVQEIPKELYYVIAELIAYSYVLRGKFPPGWKAFMGKLDVKA